MLRTALEYSMVVTRAQVSLTYYSRSMRTAERRPRRGLIAYNSEDSFYETLTSAYN